MWRYKELHIPITYQAQLERAILKQVDFHALTVPRFLVIDKARLLKSCPALGATLLRCRVLSKLENASLIVLLPNSDIAVHKDKDDDQYIGLNFPIFGCEGTHTVFYEARGEAVREKVHVDVLDDPFDRVEKPKATQGYAKYERDQVTEVSRVELTKPYWLNVGTAHNVENFKSSCRVSLSLRFSEPIVSIVNSL